MGKSLPPLGWFRTFEASARHLNFSAAADELGMTQSAVSQQVRSLEVRLATQLFIRKARGLALTDDGRKLLPMVGSAMESLGAAASLFDVGPTQGLLTIATSVSISQWILAPNMQDFLDMHPGLRIRLMSTIWPDEFNTSIADVEIRFGSEKQVGKGAARLGPDELIAVAAVDHTAPLEDSILIEAVGTSKGWQEWARKAKYGTDLSPSLHVDSYGVALDLAANGSGVALTSSLLAKSSVDVGKLKQIGQVGIMGNEGYYLATVSEAEVAKEFSKWIKTVIGTY
ncbi:LysR family transcriptional regulator [Curvivirga sp.]|uniref:LysR family transcriptional regulator n=1 Tax=Curvivirga sp. TaxID=2856848 RepID=UPI003B59A60B